MVRAILTLLALSALVYSVDIPWHFLGTEGYAKVLAKQELHPLASKAWASDRVIRKFKVFRVQATLPMSDGGIQTLDLKVPQDLYEGLDVNAEFPVRYPQKVFPNTWVRPLRSGHALRAQLFLVPLGVAFVLGILMVVKGRKQLAFLPFYRKGLETTATVTEFSIQRVMVGKYPVGRLYQLRYDLQVAKGRFQGVHTDAFVEEFLPLYKGRSVNVLYDPDQPWKSIPIAFLPRALRGKVSGVARAEGE